MLQYTKYYIPTIEVNSEVIISPKNKERTNYTDPVLYTVKNGDGSKAKPIQ